MRAADEDRPMADAQNEGGQARLFSVGNSSGRTADDPEFDTEPLLRQLKATVVALGLEWVDAWEAIITTARCHACDETLDGDSSLRVKVARDPHYAALVCGACASQIRWLQSPKSTPRRDSNEAARADWTEYFGGALYCAMCGVWEYETAASFEMHHVPRILDGCEPHTGRTIPLCSDCHRMSENLRSHQLHVRRLSPRGPSLVR
jgi:hypothetical protein